MGEAGSVRGDGVLHEATIASFHLVNIAQPGDAFDAFGEPSRRIQVDGVGISGERLAGGAVLRHPALEHVHVHLFDTDVNPNGNFLS